MDHISIVLDLVSQDHQVRFGIFVGTLLALGTVGSCAAFEIET